MAIKLDAGDFGRADMFFINPEYVVVSETLNGRAFPHDDEAIEKRCKSFEDEGQLQPVVVRRIAENKVQLVMGYCRHAAAALYNKRHPDKPMKLKCVVGTMNDEEAFRKNIVENRERQETTPVDDAVNQRRLREDYGWIDARIAEFYGCNPSYVSQLKKLLTLDSKTQILVHKREMALAAALTLADLTPEERAAALTEAAAEGTTTASVTKAVRERKIAKGKGQARSLKEVRDYFEGLTGPAEAPAVKAIADLMLIFINGKIVEKTMTKRLNNALGNLVPVTEPVAAQVATPDAAPTVAVVPATAQVATPDAAPTVAVVPAEAA